jgi:hypothetical protein
VSDAAVQTIAEPTRIPKIFLLLSGIITVVTVIRSYFPPERVKRALAGKGEPPGTVLAYHPGVARGLAGAPQDASRGQEL